MINPNEVICIYHGNCADGFGAAWAVCKALGDQCEFYPASYQQDPPDVTGKHVIMVDFCYKPEVLEQLARSAASILVLDHHKSAMEAASAHPWPSGQVVDMSNYTGRVDWERYLQNLSIDRIECVHPAIYFYFDMNRSGAGIAWDFFHPDKERPALINHIEDRDLWRFALPNTRSIQANLFSYPYDFDVWDVLMATPVEQLTRDGKAIERKHFKDIHEYIAAAKYRTTIAGHDVPVLNAPYFWSSDAGHIMAEGEPFAACYWDTPSGRQFSLRSAEDGLDVSEIAQQFGGGGHKHAAGFRLTHADCGTDKLAKGATE